MVLFVNKILTECSKRFKNHKKARKKKPNASVLCQTLFDCWISSKKKCRF